MARTVKVDMTDVESYSRVTEGQHVAKIISVDQKDSSGGDEQLVINFEVTKGIEKGGRVYCNFTLIEKALFKFKALLQALSMKADGKIRVDLDKLIGKTCIIEVEMEDYQGKLRPQIAGFRKLEAEAKETDADDEEDDDEEEVPAPKKKPAPAAKKAEPVRRKKAPEPEEDEDEDEVDADDDDEEDEPAPKKSSKKAAPPAKKATAKKKKADDDDDDDWDD